MNCQEVKELLLAFLESDLKDADKVAIETHLQSCIDCQKEKNLLEKSWVMLDGSKDLPVDRNFTSKLKARGRDQKKVESPIAFDLSDPDIQIVLGILVVAVLSLCILGGVCLFLNSHQFKEQPSVKIVLPVQRTPKP